jgi:uncharacterized circularly permuted ATP-grasp superfamily protein
VNESGGYGMLIGPLASRAECEEYRRRVEADPRGYIAQPTLALSCAPCLIDGNVESRHIDLRPFDQHHFLPVGHQYTSCFFVHR